jgi:hypothetical protein
MNPAYLQENLRIAEKGSLPDAVCSEAKRRLSQAGEAPENFPLGDFYLRTQISPAFDRVHFVEFLETDCPKMENDTSCNRAQI